MLLSCNVTKESQVVRERVDTSVVVKGFDERGELGLESVFEAKVIDLEEQLKLYANNQLSGQELMELFSEYCKVKPINYSSNNRLIELRVENEVLKYRLTKQDTTIKVKKDVTTSTKFVNRDMGVFKWWWLMAIGLVVVVLWVLKKPLKRGLFAL